MKNKNLALDSIRQLLNYSVSKMDRDTAEKLRTSRNLALERYRTLQHAPVQAWFTHHGLLTGNPQASRKHIFLAFALLLSLCLYSGITYMQHERDRIDTIDIEILTDDLPVDAYVE